MNRGVDMERNLNFETNVLSGIAIHMAWAQLEIFADDVEKIQVLAAGDEDSVRDLRIEVKEGELIIEQPQYGLYLNINESRWLQVCIRIPREWDKKIEASTISGLLNARKLKGTEISLETVSGDLRALKLSAKQLSIKTVSGDVRGEELIGGKIVFRSVSGDAALDGLDTKVLKCSSVSGGQTYSLVDSFERIDVTAVSGHVVITAPVEEMNASLRSISGRVHTHGVNISDSETAPVVRVTGVSADLKLISINK